MAKRGRPRKTEAAIVAFAEDLGRVLGTARKSAENWLGQRQAITKQLTGIRDTASHLLQQMTGAGSVNKRARRKPGRPQGRKMSAEARAKIGAAQKARWAKQKAAEKKK